MRILIINELVTKGGTEVQTKREFNYFLNKGHDVYLLTFDPSQEKVLEGRKLNIPCRYNTFKKTFHRLFSTSYTTKKIRKIIDKINPDVIHINNVWRNCLDVMKAVENYPTVQTNRDYGSICPKMTGIFDDYNACEGYKFNDCSQCVNSLGLRLKYLSMIKYNEYRKRNVDRFVAPSNALALKCTENGMETMCLNNPFEFSTIKAKNKEFSEKKIFLYYGLIAEIKGINQFFDALDCVDISNIEVWFIGEVESSYKKSFDSKIYARSYAKYLGKKKYEDIMDLYSCIYCVVVPSLWIENYPNTVLEALANKTLVIGANRGGIPELIGDDRFLFNIQSKDDFVRCLNIAINLTKSEYESITNKRYKFILNNNSQDTYYKRLMGIYEDIVSEQQRKMK